MFIQLVTVVDTRDPSTQEAKAKDFGFEASLGHIKRYRLIKVLPKRHINRCSVQRFRAKLSFSYARQCEILLAIIFS